MVENYVVFAMERKDGIDGVPGGGVQCKVRAYLSCR